MYASKNHKPLGRELVASINLCLNTGSLLDVNSLSAIYNWFEIWKKFKNIHLVPSYLTSAETSLHDFV